MKVGGFGLTRLLKIAPDKVKLANHEALVDTFSYYTAPELHRNELFDSSVDAYAFGFILFEMVEGLPHANGKTPEESSHVQPRYDGMRPSLKNKLKGYPADFKALIEECWDTHAMARPTFSEIIIRLDKVYAHCAKQGTWKESLKIWK